MLVPLVLVHHGRTLVTDDLLIGMYAHHQNIAHLLGLFVHGAVRGGSAHTSPEGQNKNKWSLRPNGHNGCHLVGEKISLP